MLTVMFLLRVTAFKGCTALEIWMINENFKHLR